jgi:hypothetical protein
MLPRRKRRPVAVINFIWRGAIIIVPLLTLGYCSLGAYRQFDPAFLLSPLDAHVLRHCGRLDRDAQCNLIPEFFSLGEPIDEVAKQMTVAGYRHWIYEGPDGTRSIDGHEMTFTDYFVGPKGGMSFACSYELSIDMLFDGAGKLEAAMGDNSTACL